jgi:leucine dehydrogenase
MESNALKLASTSALELANQLGHEEILLCSDPETGLRAIIAVHSTALGPALGGTRMLPYQTVDDALVDVLLLSRAMSYKAAAAGINYGGGKAVIIGDPSTEKSSARFRAFGRFVNRFDGQFQTGEDVGTTAEDMAAIAETTPYVHYFRESLDPDCETSAVTAFGVAQGIRACARERYGSDSLEGLTIAVQGLGKVGSHLVRQLANTGARLVATDVVPARCQSIKEEVNIEIVPPEDIFNLKANIFAPCALGGVINDRTVERFRVDIVAGAANNQIAAPEAGDRLWQRGILYAPDYVINAGGLLSFFIESGLRPKEEVFDMVRAVADRLATIFEASKQRNQPPHRVADHLTAERIAAARQHRSSVKT